MASNSPSTAQPAVADPAPLGLAAFAMTTFVLSISNAQIGTGAKGVAAAALALALVYGGIAQFAAGMWEFVRKNTFGALAFTSYGAFWISYFVFGKFVAPSIGNAGDVNAAVTVFLLSWTIFTCYMMIASFRVSTAVALVFVLLALTFLALTIGAGTSSTLFNQIGGYLGILTAIAAWYASFAGVVNATFGRDVIPTHSLAIQSH